jgi:GNAT superfamily N-acetyltransferase
MTVIRATTDHREALAPLFDAYRVFYGKGSDIQGANNFISDRLRQGDSVIFLATLGNQAAGFVQLYPTFTSVAMKRLWILNDLFVSPPHRGKGIAGSLMQTAERFAREEGAAGLMLETQVGNTKAQALYTQRGWRRSDDYFTYYLHF